MGKVRVALLDDHPVVREGLRVFLSEAPDLEVTLDAPQAEDILSHPQMPKVDVLVLDLVLGPGLSGLQALRAFKVQHPTVKILVLTSSRERQTINLLKQEGAHGYLDKTVQPDDLLEAIRLIAKGHQVWDTLPGADSPFLIDPLTLREQEVLQLLTEGKSNKEIASTLGIREKTVKVHVSHILDKLQVFDRTQAVIRAHQAGLSRIDDA